MAYQNDIAIMAHLMRRAGFGSTREDLERYVAQGYEAAVEELLHPEDAPPALGDEDLVRRYHAGQNSLMLLENAQAYWLYRMIKNETATGGEAGTVLARCLRHRVHEAQSAQGHSHAGGDVPPLRAD